MAEVANVEIAGTIENQINLPLSKAVEISFNSVKIRFGRSLITVSGIVLAIAFLGGFVVLATFEPDWFQRLLR